MDLMTYKCKCCGWSKSIPASWGDDSPRFCQNSKCEMSLKKGRGKKSFRSNPDMLEKILPVKKPQPAPTKAPKVKKKK